MEVKLWANHRTCSAIRSLNDVGTKVNWMARIRGAKVAELYQLAKQLQGYVDYKGRAVFRPYFVVVGQGQAEALLQEAAKQIFNKDILPSWSEFELPFASYPTAARRVIDLVRGELVEQARKSPLAPLGGKAKMLNTALREMSQKALEKIYQDSGLAVLTEEFFRSKMAGLSIGEQNSLLLKLLETIENENDSPDSPAMIKSRLEEMVYTIFRELSVEQFTGLTVGQAQAAMFFIFQSGEDKLKGGVFFDERGPRRPDQYRPKTES